MHTHHRPTSDLVLSNAVLTLTLHLADGTLSVLDKRTGHTWTQYPLRGIMLEGVATDERINATWVDPPTGLRLVLTLALDDDKPEFTATLTAEGALTTRLAFPHPFVTDAGTYLVIPMNEGISYPVSDPIISLRRFQVYAGHGGLCMAFWGVTDGEQGQMTIVETPDDAAIHLERVDERLCVSPEWEPQKGQFGYPRRLRYIFLDRGGHVAMCKRYRAYAQQVRLLKTLEQKRQENPNVDRLVGAVNVWCWEENALTIAEEMRAAGIERILWSNRGPADVVQRMNEMGILTSRYDNVQDVVNPEYAPFVGHSLQPQAWPKDLMIGADGNWVRGWPMNIKDGGLGEWVNGWWAETSMYQCGTVCDRQALVHARKEMAEDLGRTPYLCRFMDTTTATPWRECYHPDHPMTRSESRHWKMELLRLMSEEFHLVVGSETGHDAAVPNVSYFEGMLSLAHYRVPDAGRWIREMWQTVPSPVALFQLGQRYRLPLWELVYHDCVISHWYWGDHSSRLPSLWDKRDLLNALYGTAPMFVFNYEYWRQRRDRFVQSYRNTCPLAREVGYSEMIDHRFLTADRDVQQTTFANDVTVICNFSDRYYDSGHGIQVVPMGLSISRR